MNVKTNTCGHAYQFFTDKGALAFLPINKKVASVIWSLDNSALELDYNIDEISKKINDIFISVTGKLDVLDMKKYKLNFEYSKKIISKSIVLIGDAAHSLHPIAGQGLNLSIKDIIALKEKIRRFKYLGYSLGNQIILSDFQSERQADNAIFTFATNYLDEILKDGNGYHTNKETSLKSSSPKPCNSEQDTSDCIFGWKEESLSEWNSIHSEIKNKIKNLKC